ncbi:MAG: OmpA family protein [Magnetospirillum sp.]
MTKPHLIALAVLALTLAACADTNRVVLMPDPDGHVGKVEVTTKAGAQTLTQAKSVVAAGSINAAPKALSDTEIDKTWGAAIAAQPPRPQTFTLYFVSGTADLTPDSAAELPAILRAISARSHARLIIAGHADAVGSDEVNLRISRQRAEKVRDGLMAAGAKPEAVDVSSHGKRNPLVPTADGVSEPKNRRVSVTIQ